MLFKLESSVCLKLYIAHVEVHLIILGKILNGRLISVSYLLTLTQETMHNSPLHEVSKK